MSEDEAFKQYWLVRFLDAKTGEEFRAPYQEDDPKFPGFFDAVNAAEKLLSGREITYCDADWPGVTLTCENGDSVSITLTDTNCSLDKLRAGWSDGQNT